MRRDGFGPLDFASVLALLASVRRQLDHLFPISRSPRNGDVNLPVAR
jgi:hypothetical protein